MDTKRVTFIQCPHDDCRIVHPYIWSFPYYICFRFMCQGCKRMLVFPATKDECEECEYWVQCILWAVATEVVVDAV